MLSVPWLFQYWRMIDNISHHFFLLRFFDYSFAINHYCFWWIFVTASAFNILSLQYFWKYCSIISTHFIFFPNRHIGWFAAKPFISGNFNAHVKHRHHLLNDQTFKLNKEHHEFLAPQFHIVEQIFRNTGWNTHRINSHRNESVIAYKTKHKANICKCSVKP